MVSSNGLLFLIFLFSSKIFIAICGGGRRRRWHGVGAETRHFFFSCNFILCCLADSNYCSSNNSRWGGKKGQVFFSLRHNLPPLHTTANSRLRGCCSVWKPTSNLFMTCVSAWNLTVNFFIRIWRRRRWEEGGVGVSSPFRPLKKKSV